MSEVQISRIKKVIKVSPIYQVTRTNMEPRYSSVQLNVNVFSAPCQCHLRVLCNAFFRVLNPEKISILYSKPGQNVRYKPNWRTMSDKTKLWRTNVQLWVSLAGIRNIYYGGICMIFLGNWEKLAEGWGKSFWLFLNVRTTIVTEISLNIYESGNHVDKVFPKLCCTFWKRFYIPTQFFYVSTSFQLRLYIQNYALLKVPQL